ncbi:MAG: nucleotidyl transferase AbiEii/AbiGii toxin family protein [Candidatus Izemoplasma sp.]
MKLHTKEEFTNLILLTSAYKNIPESAIRRDYYIVMILKNLMQSEYADVCVFKGGTSISKCYQNSIERFSEDIDLTYMPSNELGDNQVEKKLKSIEKALSLGFESEKINGERNRRNKSAWFWFKDKKDQIKLEIGSSVRPHPYAKRTLKTYIHEYLEVNGFDEEIKAYELTEIKINVLDITRTFLDKIMAVKRHAICNTLNKKVRHIYDIVQLYKLEDIQVFLEDKVALKKIIQITKQTDSFYLQKRNLPKEFNPLEPYLFSEWKYKLDKQIRRRYETLHEDLLYTDQKQSFDEVFNVFDSIDKIFRDINE